MVGYCCGGFRLPGLESLGGTLALPGGTGTISAPACPGLHRLTCLLKAGLMS